MFAMPRAGEARSVPVNPQSGQSVGASAKQRFPGPLMLYSETRAKISAAKMARRKRSS